MTDLADKGDEGTDHLGKRRVLYSLRQLEYLQYYIHEMRLTDPEWVMSISSQVMEGNEDKENVPPTKKEDIPEWVPLPANILDLDFFVKIVCRSRLPLTFPH